MNNNLFSAFLLFGLLGFNFDMPEIPRVDVQGIIEETTRDIPKSSAGTYSDASYSNRQTDFSPGQTIYFFMEADVYENASRSLVLQDSNKNKITDIPVSIVGNGYATQFNAPSTQGMYYLLFEVKGDGISIVFQTNINVGEGDGNVKSESTVISDINNQVITGDDAIVDGENEQIMPNNRLNLLQIVGWWVGQFNELIINILTKA